MQEKERKAVEKGKRLQPESRLSPEISRVLDECLIKQEIVRGRLSLWDWKHTGTWHFVAGYHQGKDSYGKKRGKAFDLLACMEQREDNTCSFATMDELEHGKKQMSVDATTVKHVLGWFEGRKEYGRHPECAVVTPSGHCFLIMRLDNRFLLPEKKTYESIMDRLPEGKVNLRRKGSLTLKDGTVVEDPLEVLFGALTNINVWNAENGHAVLYTSGIIPENLRDNRPSFARACIMRAIVAEDGSEVDQDDPEIQAILDALWMPLIRSTRDPSVLPFQAKYCREYLRLCGAYEKAYREEDKYFDE